MAVVHPAATDHLPMFITAPGQTDVLMVVMWIVFIAAILGIGVFFFWLHSLPERMVHNKIQFDIVAVLALLSLFTHQHAFWVAALLIALITFPDFKFPDFSALLGRIANSLESIASKAGDADYVASVPPTNGQQRSAAEEKPADVVQTKPKSPELKAVAAGERTTAPPQNAPKREREKAGG